MPRGLFISFEGGEGAGKTTQLDWLARRIDRGGGQVVKTREPGGTQGAEAIRALLVEGDGDRWSATAETFLLYAARVDHLERVIEPAVASGAVVLCDRFADSTRAYQGAAGGSPAGLIDALESQIMNGRWPDLTLIFDVPPELGLARARRRGGGQRFENKDLKYHEKIRDAFLTIARAHPSRCRVIDANGSLETVASRVWEATAPFLEGS